ncbi:MULTISPECIES: site-specific integrase [Dyadobacter]|uniref:Site-specific integrase n=1 Tax=Dyadobacter chenhuakuii TaxID=2909339 RepID=A0A9X1TT63_9BACT|nr:MULTISPECIES: site-specific integrase [Dyadobacter]MCF2497662.1 site-specific integrase [Dyadobacter chenhuakuii]MCF2521139.1 site-specific integrase [Dyadobacter sp. CY351]
MKTKISLLFYLKKPKNYQKGPVPIYLRITVESKRVEFTTGRECEPSRWNTVAGRATGAREAVKSVNSYLGNLEQQLLDAHAALVRDDALITAETIKDKFLGVGPKQRLLMTVIADHNERMKALVGQEYAIGTFNRYKVLERHTLAFLNVTFNTTDFDISRIDFAFIADYEFYLRSVRKMGNNAVVKHMKMFRKIVNICLGNGWMNLDPYLNFKGKFKKVEKAILTKAELDLMASKEFASDRLAQVRDTFLFCCFTGLAYSDIQKLQRSQIARGIDGEQWIFSQRTKTNVKSHIPLLPEALQIIDRYRDHPLCESRGLVLPVPSNQKMNDYLKEIAVICGINKVLTSHVARHTFATTITLQNGVPIESVSKMLGHTNIRTTQIYAKILDTKVSEDMQALKGRLSRRSGTEG